MTLRLVSAGDIRTGLRRIRWRRRLGLAVAVYVAVLLVAFHLWWWSRCPRCRG